MLNTEQFTDSEHTGERFWWMMSPYARILGVTAQRTAEVVQPTSPCGSGHDQFPLMRRRVPLFRMFARCWDPFQSTAPSWRSSPGESSCRPSSFHHSPDAKGRESLLEVRRNRHVRCLLSWMFFALSISLRSAAANVEGTAFVTTPHQAATRTAG